MGGWGGWGWVANFWNNRKCPWLPISAPNISLTTYFLNIMVSTTQTLSQMKSQECIGHIKQHFIWQHILSHISPMTFKILSNAVSKVGSISLLCSPLLLSSSTRFLLGLLHYLIFLLECPWPTMFTTWVSMTDHVYNMSVHNRPCLQH